MLKLTPIFNIHTDVLPQLLEKEHNENVAVVDMQILNVERDEGIVYCWKGTAGNTRIGKYNPHSKQNKVLYAFDKSVCVSSCSLNREETLLAVSLTRTLQGGEDHFKPVSKYLTLLIEIHPVNNTKVIKAVDCKVKVQFLYPQLSRRTVLDSHLLVAAEDGYIDWYHIPLGRQEDSKVVIQNTENLVKDRVTDEFCWVQWDSDSQRLFFISSREKHVLKCIQFFPDHSFEMVFELPVELPRNPFTSVRFMNFGYDRYQEHKTEELNLIVFTDRTGIMCVCYSHPVYGKEDYMYTIVFVDKGFSKTFSVALEQTTPPGSNPTLQPLIISLGHYVVVFLSGQFLHLINCWQQDLLCHSLFLSGADAHVDALEVSSVVTSVMGNKLLDWRVGKIYAVDLSCDFLFYLMNPDRPEAERLAALHCVMVHLPPHLELETRIIDWITDNLMMSFNAFDQIQEFILGSLYRTCCSGSLSLDKVLPYSSVFEKKELPVALTAIPGVKCTPALLSQPVITGKAQSLQGFWKELQGGIERTKYLESVPNPRYRFSQARTDWSKLRDALNSETKKSFNYQQLEENSKKVLSVVDMWHLDKGVLPLFKEVDQTQRALIGLMVDKLREHLNKNLPQLGKKKVEMLAVNYTAKLLELFRQLLETLWLKLNLAGIVLCLKQQGSTEECTVFHAMCRVLEAAEGLCVPVPPGYSTLMTVLAVRCQPRHTFLLYVDHGFLHLTETFVSRLMTDLDNSDGNEELKFSVLKRLPETLSQRVCQFWDHPVGSGCITQQCVRRLLGNYTKTKSSMQLNRDKLCSCPEFLPLTCLTAILSDMEQQGLSPSEEQEIVDSRFVVETALRQTWIALGFEHK